MHHPTPDQQWTMIHAERARLAADLDGLDDDQWSHPSLCDEWSVEDVVAHLSAAATTGRGAWLRSIVAAGFRPAVHNRRRLAENRGPTPEETLERFRSVVDLRVAPTKDLWAWLGEVVVHATDVREPLGIPTQPDPRAVDVVARGFATRDFAVSSRSAVKGLRVCATDGDLELGDGPVVEGSTLDLVMAMAGRGSAVGRLAGEGVPVLAQRVGAH